MFGSLFGRKPTGFDTRDWHPQIDHALALFEKQDWTGLSLLVSRQSVNSAFRLITALGVRSELDSDLGNYPHTPGLLTILGGIHTCWAWRHRGFGAGEDVETDRWPRFFESLETASDLLTEALELRENAACALGFMGRVLTGVGDTDQLAIIETRFLACPDRPLDGCAMFLQAHSPKWHGDHDSMFTFANREALDERLHPARHALPARAHVEKWLYDACMDEDPEVNRHAERYMSQPEIVADICALNDAFNREMADNPAAQADESACRFAHDNLGYALYLAGQRQEAARHVSALGQHPGQWPWVYSLGEPPAREWGRLRKSLGLSRRAA
ncbi:MAG: hypothetical protein CME88_13390 [Hirschia sp.]|nr:hypothetical protein [Hirschia sp.]MBF19364.1 hypothetical protein [Hirschia sp.]